MRGDSPPIPPVGKTLSHVHINKEKMMLLLLLFSHLLQVMQTSFSTFLFMMSYSSLQLSFISHFYTSINFADLTLLTFELEAIIGHVHKYQTQLYFWRKLKKKFLWITSVDLNFRHWYFPHRRKSWLFKYLLHSHLQIFI